MTMDCIRAQELISAALDRAPVDAAELAEAKSHCRTCADCSAFVRAMLAVQRAEPVAPSQDLAERIMRSVAEDSARSASSSSAASSAAPTPVPPASAADGQTATPPPAKTWSELLERAWHPRNRRAFMAWAAGAAVLFIVTAIGALAGVRAILVPQQLADSKSVESQLAEPSAGEQDLSAQTGASVPQSAGPSFITLNGTVYRLSPSPSPIDVATLDRVGTTRSSLGAEGAVRSQEVLASKDSSATTVYIESGDTMLAFDRVARSYGGRSYVLSSEPIERFGEWPRLPDGTREPSSADGGTVFKQDGVDDSGTTIFVRRGSTANDGIAIAPNAPAGDAIAGCPSWTWWTPSP